MMSTVEADRRMNQQPSEPTLSDFFDAIRDARPFAAVRVNEPSISEVDVASIHSKEFDRLTARAEQALRMERGIGVALMGSAGVGKSHLLSRLSRWANERKGTGPTRACYVFLHNILADPDRLPRFLLKYVVNILVRGRRSPMAGSPLFEMVSHAVSIALKEESVPASDRTLSGAASHFVNQMAKVGVEAEVARALYGFFRYAYPTQTTDARRDYVAATAVGWLSGEEIDTDAAEQLGLAVPGDGPVELKDDAQVEQVLLALCHLAKMRGQPFLLCIDQVDNLDGEKIQALSRFLHAILDHAPNLLVISSGVKGTMLGFVEQGQITEATWDRIGEYKLELGRIFKDDARQILEARLERFLDPFMQLEPVRRHVREDALFPLGRKWLEKCLGDGTEFRPRDVLMWARDEWEEQQAAMERMGEEAWLERWPEPKPEEPPGGGGTENPTDEQVAMAIDEKVGRKIEEAVEGHRLQPGGLPPDAGNLVGLVELLLGQCLGRGPSYTLVSVERMGKKKGKLPGFDLLVRERREPDGREVTTGIGFVTNMGQAASRALGRLLNCEDPPDHRLLVTDDERRPLTVGPQGKAYYKDLQKLGERAFQHVKMNLDQYARIDAMVGVVGQAKVGDLEVEVSKGQIQVVTEAEVVDSHHRQDRYRSHPLLRHLLTEEPAPEEKTKVEPSNLNEPEVRSFIMAQLAWQMGSTKHALVNAYIKNHPALKLDLESTKKEFRRIIEGLHADGQVIATPQDDDLFVQYLGS